MRSTPQIKIFLGALLIRWAYAIILYAFMGDAGITGVDSISYLHGAEKFASAIAGGELHGLAWLGPSTIVMPLAQWLFGLAALVFQNQVALGYVMAQGVIDAATCVLVYRMAWAVTEHWAQPAGIAAALNPTQIVLSAIVYTDTPFLFFAALFLLGATQWLRSPSWCAAIMIGAGLAGASLVRAVGVPWAPLLLMFLLIAGLIARRELRTVIAQLAVAGTIVLSCVAPVVVRNATQFGTWELTSQGGQHLALWVTPLVKEAHDGTPWPVTYDKMRKTTIERYPKETQNPFEQSRQFATIGREELVKLGWLAIAKSWLVGAAINLASPAIALSPPVSQLPHTGFYETAGASSVEKVVNFLFHSNNTLYAWSLLVGIAGLVVVRAIQLAGVFSLLQQPMRLPAMCLFGLWIGYVLAANGPVASPKYRLPLEPVLIVLAAAGYELIRFRKSTKPA